MTTTNLNTYPHEGGCTHCRQARVCNACGNSLEAYRCTNGRCESCHSKHCTQGGATSPGHGYGTIFQFGVRADQEAKKPGWTVEDSANYIRNTRPRRLFKTDNR